MGLFAGDAGDSGCHARENAIRSIVKHLAMKYARE